MPCNRSTTGHPGGNGNRLCVTERLGRISFRCRRRQIEELLLHQVLHFPQSRLLDIRVDECGQHAQLQPSQPIEKSQSKHVQLDKSQEGADDQTEKTSPSTSFPTIARPKFRVVQSFGEIVIVVAILEMYEPLFEQTNSVARQIDVFMYADVLVSTHISAE